MSSDRNNEISSCREGDAMLYHVDSGRDEHLQHAFPNGVSNYIRVEQQAFKLARALTVNAMRINSH